MNRKIPLARLAALLHERGPMRARRREFRRTGWL